MLFMGYMFMYSRYSHGYARAVCVVAPIYLVIIHDTRLAALAETNTVRQDFLF